MSIVVVLPTYNEVNNIALLVPELLALPLDLAVIVVDDNSPDGTGDVADRFAAEFPGRVEVIHRAGKMGLGSAYLAGFKRAFERKPDWVLTMDADFSHSPKYIPAMAELGKGADLVIGSRYVPGGGAVDSPAGRRFISRCANMLAHALLGLKAEDATAGFKLYRAKALESLPPDRVLSSGYSFQIEILFLAERSGWEVRELPILFHDRRLDESKISRNEVFKALQTLARLAPRRFRR